MSAPGHIRRRAAVTALLLWVIGLEVLPGMHIALHALLPAHHHGHEAGGFRVERTARSGAGTHVHGHDGEAHHHGATPDHSDGPHAPPGDHGEGSIEHRGMAVLAAPLILVAPPPRRAPVRIDAVPPAWRAPVAEARRPCARGPPLPA